MTQIMKFQCLNPFAKPDHNTLAVVELAEARRELLAAQRAADYSNSIVIYNQTRIKRLEEHLAQA